MIDRRDPYYQPKGGMCRSCRHALRVCSHLDFTSMPVLHQGQHTVIVRCTDYQRDWERKGATL